MRRTKKDAQITRESILNTALELFLAKGYSKTSQEDIVRALDLTRGAFQGHFKNKEALFKELMKQEFHFISNLVTKAFMSRTDPKETIRSLMVNVIDNFYNNKRFRDFIQLTWFKIEVHESSKIMKDKTVFNEYFTEEIYKILKKAESNGAIIPYASPKITAIHITCVITGIYRLYFVTPRFLRRKSVAHEICAQYLNQLFSSPTN